jgi:hypothetical protein
MLPEARGGRAGAAAGSPLSYSVELLADDPEDLDPAAAALSRSRHWVLPSQSPGREVVRRPGEPRQRHIEPICPARPRYASMPV